MLSRQSPRKLLQNLHDAFMLTIAMLDISRLAGLARVDTQHEALSGAAKTSGTTFVHASPQILCAGKRAGRRHAHHKLPAKLTAICCSLGLPLVARRRAYMAMTKPGVQKPHWLPCSVANRCCTGCRPALRLPTPAATCPMRQLHWMQFHVNNTRRGQALSEQARIGQSAQDGFQTCIMIWPFCRSVSAPAKQHPARQNRWMDIVSHDFTSLQEGCATLNIDKTICVGYQLCMCK